MRVSKLLVNENMKPLKFETKIYSIYALHTTNIFMYYMLRQHLKSSLRKVLSNSKSVLNWREEERRERRVKVEEEIRSDWVP